MIARCYYRGSTSYKFYGGRGIKVCNRWLDFESFLKDMGVRPKGMTLERKNNNGNYSKANCRWATHVEQMNNRRNSTIIKARGMAMTVTQWARHLRVSRNTLFARIDRGWSHKKIVGEPISEHSRNMTHKGVTRSLLGWAKHTGIPRTCIWRMANKGWSIQQMLDSRK